MLSKWDWPKSLLQCQTSQQCGYANFDFNRDLKDLKSQDPADRRRIADEVRDACIQVGFFYGLDLQLLWDTLPHLQSKSVVNHGIPEHMTEGALEMAKNFFSLPIEAKMEVGGTQSFVSSIMQPM